MAYIRGSPQEPRSSEEASEEEAESDEALARRLQAEEQGRPVARFKLLDRVEARYKDPELRGGTWSREYYAATVVDVLPPKTQKRPHEYMIHWDDGSEDQLVLEDYVRPAPEAPAAAPRDRDGKRGLANGLRTGAPPPKKRGRPSKKGGRPPKTVTATASAPPWTPDEEQHLQELVDEHGEGDWSWPTIAEELGTGRTKDAVEAHYNTMLERRRMPGTDQEQKLRIDASGRVATLLEKKQRGWLVVKLDENGGEDGAPFEQRSIRSNFVTFLDSAGNDVIPTKKKRRRPTAAPGAAPAPRKKRPTDFAEGDRVTVLDSADNHGGRSGVIVEKNTAWWRVKLDGDDEATSIRRKDLQAAAPTAPGTPVPAPAPAATAPPLPPPPAAAPSPPPPAPPIPPNAFWPGGCFYQPPPGAFGPGPVPLVVAPAPAPDAAEAALAALNGPPPAWVPPPPAAPGLRLVGGNTPAELAQFFRRSFPGRAADGDTFERLVDEFQLRPADLLQMTEEQCQTTLRENEFPLLVVFTLQRRLREAYLGPHLAPGGGVPGG